LRSTPAPSEQVPPEPPFWREFAAFLIENKAWWLVPIALALAVIGALAALTTTGAAPFIYSLF